MIWVEVKVVQRYNATGVAVLKRGKKNITNLSAGCDRLIVWGSCVSFTCLIREIRSEE
jgi:hypothetical protein